MASRKKFRSAGLASLIALTLVLAGCSNSSDPENWDDADANGKIEENLIRACVKADDGKTADAGALADYCQCTYDGLRQEYADDFEGFLNVEDGLRSEAEAIPPNVLAILDGCTDAHLGS